MREKYLDGIRGWAALSVVFSHMRGIVAPHTTFTVFLWDGQLAVYIFFVLSGYVLSAGYLHNGRTSILVELAIRRYPRLTIPVAASCLLAFVMMKMGWMHNAEAGALADSKWLASFYAFPPSLSSVTKFSLWDVYFDPSTPSYNAVLWTMQYELAGSILLLAMLWIFRPRKARWGAYVFFVVTTSSSPFMSFVLGAMLAEWPPIKTSTLAHGALATALVIAAFRPGTISAPPVLSIIATLIIGSIASSKTLGAVFENRLSLFLGRISFPLYLTHFVVICSLSSWVCIEAGPVTAALVTVPVAIGMAFVFLPIDTAAIWSARKFSAALIKISKHWIGKDEIAAASVAGVQNERLTCGKRRS
jgi:peptidoglycan/LPS O-acetylase OafA/YrhL